MIVESGLVARIECSVVWGDQTYDIGCRCQVQRFK